MNTIEQIKERYKNYQNKYSQYYGDNIYNDIQFYSKTGAVFPDCCELYKLLMTNNNGFEKEFESKNQPLEIRKYLELEIEFKKLLDQLAVELTGFDRSKYSIQF